MLTEDQITHLFNFCEDHSVHFYDVQVELVDHLANAVEKEMDVNKSLTFEKALYNVHRSFGVMGFAPLVSEKQKAAQKQNRLLFWQIFKKQFTWPKVTLFFLIYSIVYMLVSFNPSTFKWICVVVLCCSVIAQVQILLISRKVKRTKRNFSFLNLSSISVYVNIPLNLFIMFNMFESFKYFLKNTAPYYPVWASLTCATYVILNVALSQTINMIKRKAYTSYPEVFSPAK